MFDINITLKIDVADRVLSLLSGVSSAAVAASAPVASGKASTPADTAISETSLTSAPVTPAAETASPSETPAGVDAHGHPWSADLHASTGSKTKEGLWRMKVGVTRPDPLPGFPKEDGVTGTNTSGAAAPQPSDAATTAVAGPATDEDDEFAAFSEAIAKDTATPAAVPARKWTDADLGALCNQAAVKLGDPAPIKTLIAEYVAGTGATAHSRNIPDDKREAFAKAIEAKAGIEFVG